MQQSAMNLYHAKLIVHDLPKMSKSLRKTLAIWLRSKAAEVEGDVVQYSNTYTSKLMK